MINAQLSHCLPNDPIPEMDYVIACPRFQSFEHAAPCHWLSIYVGRCACASATTTCISSDHSEQPPRTRIHPWSPSSQSLHCLPGEKIKIYYLVHSYFRVGIPALPPDSPHNTIMSNLQNVLFHEFPHTASPQPLKPFFDPPMSSLPHVGIHQYPL